MKKQMRQLFLLVFFGVTLFALLMNFPAVLQFLGNIFSLITPILVGLIIAFVLNVPMNAFERLIRKLTAKAKKQPGDGLVSALSLGLTLLSIAGVLTIAFTMLIPELVNSVQTITPLVQEQWPKWVEFLKQYNIDISSIGDLVSNFNLESITGNAGSVFGTAVNAATTTISGIASGVFGLIIGIYILLSKKMLSLQLKMLMHANLKENTVKRLSYIAELARTTYSKFLTGQFMEAIILGVLIYIGFKIFRLPYAGLIAFLTGIFAFVPYIGAFAACFIGAFLTLLVDPSKVLICIGVYMVIQFIENQFIYPNVVGTSVGLSPLWTLLAALLGGKLLGLPGIIFFIPLAAMLYVLLRENTLWKLERKVVDPNVSEEASQQALTDIREAEERAEDKK